MSEHADDADGVGVAVAERLHRRPLPRMRDDVSTPGVEADALAAGGRRAERSGSGDEQAARQPAGGGGRRRRGSSWLSHSPLRPALKTAR